jgi:hypothetical protein
MRPNTPAQADYSLLFDVRRSVRYHDRRRAWFDLLHSMAGLSALFLFAAILFSTTGAATAPPWLAALAIAAGLVGVDVLADFASSAARHQSLRTRFIMLEAALQAEPAAKHHAARLHIEADEPPIYRALDLLCHNEQMRADGHPPDSEHWASVPLYQRLTCHLFRWPDLAA